MGQLPWKEIIRLVGIKLRLDKMKKRVFDDNYEDIIDFPHHVSPIRNKMSVLDRAAQFSPFAALTGYEAAVQETAKTTQEKMEIEFETEAFYD